MKSTIPRYHAQLLATTPRWSGRFCVTPASIPREWRHWLNDAGSLTKRLQALDPSTFSVKVIRQYCGPALPTEQADLKLHGRQPVWVREVSLCLGQTELVRARTAIPLTSLARVGQQIRHLGNRSLGSYLFRQPSLRRQPLKFSRTGASTVNQPNPFGWARRSVFTIHGAPLLVTEAFSSLLVSASFPLSDDTRR
ncbi:chorismate lyase [Oceanobacter sp. 4_MG-2023]|uniref:chorismate--pyruvate lyase family protein n=1 Tax=Oceanobacter sp. 4_MG-2023 TaxID=3062623 RepID=UPI002732CFEE|nr:chorismate lyase [Oceanobacter sp. 4_MG-2023]MDP2547790.1 chorismate lyase [Oceanobacter sp. 4_MG-2023]